MHLWPSTRIRESFKHAYITKLDWNLHRMKIQQNLLDKEQASAANGDTTQKSNSVSFGCRALGFCTEVLLLLSCCYCCYCCGACIDEEEEER